MKKSQFIICVCLVMTAPAWGVIDFQADPIWTSADSRCSTGGAVGDVDGDGYLDFVVANGNDMAIEPEVVYFGSAGGLATSPLWISGDTDYSGHCDLGDLDGDGLPELVVGNYIESSQGFTPSITKIYYNLGDQFESSPSWTSSDLNNTFSVALGDVDGDGDLDIACANGEAYTHKPQQNDLYLNTDGIFDDFPAWISGDEDASYDVMFADFDADGDLDLAVANSGAPTKVYSNLGTELESFPSWQADFADSDNSLSWGDIDSDGWLELAVITNDQLSPGTGKIKIFKNRGGVLDTYPEIILEIPVNGMGSAVMWQDFDFDGDQDLATGSWWGTASIFENSGTELSAEPTWTGSNTFVVEVLEYLPTADAFSVEETFYADGNNALFTLSKTPIIRIEDILVSGTPINIGDYCYDSTMGWLSLGVELIPGEDVIVTYMPAGAGYLLGTSWGNSGAQGPNYGYMNLSPEQTPTPFPEDRVLEIKINEPEFSGGDAINVFVEILNPLDAISVDFYTIMEVEGLYFFYPGWKQTLDKSVLNLDAADKTRVPVFLFSFPEPIGYSGVIRLYSAIFHPETFDFVCPLDFVDFRLQD